MDYVFEILKIMSEKILLTLYPLRTLDFSGATSLDGQYFIRHLYIVYPLYKGARDALYTTDYY